MEPRHYRAIASAFTPGVVRQLAETSQSEALAEILKFISPHSRVERGVTLGNLYQILYETLNRSYRTEYIYKNAILSKRLIGRHSLRTAQVLSEFRAAASKADVVILNGTSTAYEIKSEFDDLTRLPNQLRDYLTVFDYVYLVANKNHLKQAESLVPEEVGLIELTKRYTLRTHKVATSNATNIEPEALIDSMRQHEFIRAVELACGPIPSLPNTRIYEYCRRKFASLNPKSAHDIAFSVLADTRRQRINNNIFSRIPSSMRALALTVPGVAQRLEELVNTLERPYEQAI